MLIPVCVSCHLFFVVERVGVAFEESVTYRVPDSPRLAAPVAEAHTRPYRLWMADLLRCPGCDTSILVRAPGQRPIAEHYQDDYAEQVAAYDPEVRGVE